MTWINKCLFGSINDRNACSISGIFELIVNDTAVAVSKVSIEAGIAWEFAAIIDEGRVLISHAESASEAVVDGAGEAISIGGECKALRRDVDAEPAFEELSAVALDALDAGVVDPCVAGGAVEAWAIVGVIPVAGNADLHASIIHCIVPKAVFAVEHSVWWWTISEDGHEVAIGAILAKSILLVDGALGDGFEALSKDIDLNLVAAVGVVDCGNLCSIGKGNHVGGVSWAWVGSCVVGIAWDRVCSWVTSDGIDGSTHA